MQKTNSLHVVVKLRFKKIPFKTTWRGQYSLVKDGKTEFPLTADSVNLSVLA